MVLSPERAPGRHATASAPAPDPRSTSAIEPVPLLARRLGFTDIGVLWGDLSVGLLVLAAGALLVGSPGQGGLGMAIGPAMAAIALGSVLGALLLGLVSAAGFDRAVPTMVLLRPVLGRQGSCVPSVLNVLQLVGWTAFEFWAIALFADGVTVRVFHVQAFHATIVIVAVACTAMALAGPAAVINRWLKPVGLWIVLATAGWLTFHLLGRPHPTVEAGAGAPFGPGLDLVIAMPVSWLPLIMDYNRFASGRGRSMMGTAAGYAIGNAWFYGLGALLVVAGGLGDPSPGGIAAGLLGMSSLAIVGVALLLALLAGEADQPFADIYSAALSALNLWPGLPRRALVIGIGAAAAAIAEVLTVGDYQAFLLLLGSVFVPLFAVVLAQWAVGGLRAGRPEAAWRPAPLAVWLLGFICYQWFVPTGPASWVTLVIRALPGAGSMSSLGASLPSFALTFVVALACGLATGLRGDRRGIHLTGRTTT